MTSPVKLPPLPTLAGDDAANYFCHVVSVEEAQAYATAYAEQAVREALAAQNPVAWRYWNEKSKSWNVTTSAVVADAMREFGRIVESLCAPPQTSADKDPPC